MRKLILIFILNFIYSLAFAQIDVTISKNPDQYIYCSGQQIILTANVTGGIQPYSYTWNNSSITSAITINQEFSGEYNVTVTDNNSVTDSAKVFIEIDYIKIDTIEVLYIGDSAKFDLYISGEAVTWNWTCSNIIQILPPEGIFALDSVSNPCCLIVTSIDGCLDTSCFIILAAPAPPSPPLSNNKFEIFPNPATDIITIENNCGSQKDLTLILRNCQGKELETRSIFIDKSYTIDLSYLKKGLYILTLLNDYTFYNRKLFIQK